MHQAGQVKLAPGNSVQDVPRKPAESSDRL
jgi:hypothetical protein